LILWIEPIVNFADAVVCGESPVSAGLSFSYLFLSSNTLLNPHNPLPMLHGMLRRATPFAPRPVEFIPDYFCVWSCDSPTIRRYQTKEAARRSVRAASSETKSSEYFSSIKCCS
jgi:hypothetical protein